MRKSPNKQSRQIIIFLRIILFILLTVSYVKAQTVSVTGGIVTTSGFYTKHTFTSSGTFSVITGGTVEYLVADGGGGKRSAGGSGIVIIRYPTSGILPIELLEFLGICEGAVIKLNWSTASEINNDYFTIERSFDGVNFNILGTGAGAGNSIQTLHYTFVDENSMDGIYYYRLKQTDFNGTFKYSKLIDVACYSEFYQDIMVYPNPASEVINVITSNKISSIQVINNLDEYIMVFKNSNGNYKCALNIFA